MPGDKSISHRAAMVAALAQGTSRLADSSTGGDCAATVSCLRQLGVGIEQTGNEVVIHGTGVGGLRASPEPLDCRNSATTMRLLAGILGGQSFTSTLTGDESLRSRPMERIIEPLRMMGANVSSNDGRAPLVIEGRQPLNGIKYELLVPSAQVKSCILFAGLSAIGRTEVIDDSVTRDHTERMLRWFGVPVEMRDGEREGSRVTTLVSPERFSGRDTSVPGDMSSAAYFIAAAALLSGSALEIAGVGMNPTRTLFLKQLRMFGFDVEASNEREECNEPLGDIHIRGPKTIPSSEAESMMTLRSSLIPQLIDELSLLAVVGSQIEGGIEIRDAAELRLKESDRIAGTVQNLRAMGAEVEEFDDGLRVAGPVQLRGAKIDPHKDHRIAMAFTIAALVAKGETEIKDADCVAVSFPEFFDLLDSVVER
jgi:3-phosphoshikimate 1-carboxyvinyltransferase